MYNGIGLTSVRGSGTNGYVQRNMAHVSRDRTARAKAVNAAKEELAQRRRLENYELRCEREMLLRADAPGIRRVRSNEAKRRPVSARPVATAAAMGRTRYS